MNRSTNAFVLRIAHVTDIISEALEKDHLIIGWAEAEGLLDLNLEWEEFRGIISEAYFSEEENLRKAGSAAGHMWRFIRDMKAGDLVVVPFYSEFYVGKVDGQPFYDKSKVGEGSAYRRPVRWLNDKRAIPRKYARSALLSRMKTRGTSAYATDLVQEIKSCLEIAERGTEPSFETDLRSNLIEATLNELQRGRMENFGFEELIKTVLEGLGATAADIVSRRYDRGIDIYATFLVAGSFRQVVGIQAKHYGPEPPVGPDVVLQLIRGIEEGPEPVTLGMVITSGVFNREAEAEAERYESIPIELVDGKQLAGLIVDRGLEVLRRSSSIR